MYKDGYKIYKEGISWDDYSAAAEWCNHNKAMIVESEDYYEVVIKGGEVLTQDELVKRLRRRREAECFPIVNRGKLWYDNLTISQLRDLQTWYQAWLDVTQTKVAPERPEWL